MTAPTADPGTIVAGLTANASPTSRRCGHPYIAYEPTPLTAAERDRVYRRVHALLFYGEAEGGDGQASLAHKPQAPTSAR